MNRHLLRNLVLAALGLLGLGLAAVTIWLWQLDPREIARLIANQSEARLGRTLQIDGNIGFRLSLQPTLKVEQVRFANAQWGSSPDMLRVGSAEVQLAILPLFKGEVEIKRIVLDSPEILLETNARGEKNRLFTPTGKTGAGTDTSNTPSRQSRIDIAQVDIRNATIDFRPAPPAKQQQFQIDSLMLNSSDGRSQLTARLKALGLPATIDGNLPDPLSLANATSPETLRLNIVLAGDTKIVLDGTMDLRPEAQKADRLALDLHLQAPRPTELARQIDIILPRLPSLELQGKLRLNADTIRLETLLAQLGNSQFAGSVSMNLKTSAINAALKASRIDLREIGEPILPAGGNPPAAQRPADARVFSDAPLPLATLARLNAQADLQADALILKDGRQLQGLSASLRAAGGRVCLTPAQLQIEGKPLRLSLNADASNGKTLGVDATLEGQAIPLPALIALLGQNAADTRGGPTDLAVRLTAQGSSTRSLMASANGDVRIVVGEGRWDNRLLESAGNLAQFFNALDPQGSSGTSTLKCAVIRFPVRQGIATIDNGIALETDRLLLSAGGSVDLRNETLDIGARPSPPNGLGGDLTKLAQLVRLSGTFANPRVTTDQKAAVATALELGIAAATQGKGALAQLLKPSAQTTQPCDLALGKAVSKSANEKAATPQNEQRAPAQEINEAVDALKRLFR
ncbi:MAG: hypothetical protein CGU28_10960 [Candidatus Dactylopiibacterium carminicum]|nr:MAG: hypothetical protein CGU28_10960 [Candidatus Dactylopiibacterium carminicum]